MHKSNVNKRIPTKYYNEYDRKNTGNTRNTLYAVLSYLETREDLKNKLTFPGKRVKYMFGGDLVHTKNLNEKTGVIGPGTQFNMARPKFKPEC